MSRTASGRTLGADMSRENVERLRAGYDALARGDFASVLALFDAGCLVEDHDRSLDGPRVDRGGEGFMRVFSEVNEGFEAVRYTPDRFDDLGERVIVEARRTGVGAVSGVRVEERQFHVFDFEGELIVRFRSFLDAGDALKAAQGTADGASQQERHRAEPARSGRSGRP